MLRGGKFAVVVPVHVPDSGLPWWQQALLTVLGCLIAFGLLYLLSRLINRRNRRNRRK
jgi:hypothetical protein